jgi:hypothetical protein
MTALANHPDSGAHRGPYIPFLDDEQRPHFLRHNLVIEIDEAEAPVVESRHPEPASPSENGAVPELVEECIKKLDGADVASDAGAPRCRTALRERRISFSNETIAQAVKQRKLRSA